MEAAPLSHKQPGKLLEMQALLTGLPLGTCPPRTLWHQPRCGRRRRTYAENAAKKLSLFRAPPTCPPWPMIPASKWDASPASLACIPTATPHPQRYRCRPPRLSPFLPGWQTPPMEGPFSLHPRHCPSQRRALLYRRQLPRRNHPHRARRQRLRL